MNGELNFEAMPFQASDGFRTLASEQSGFEFEEEFGRRAPSRSRRRSFGPRAPGVVPKRPGLPPAFHPGIRKKPPVYPPPFPPGWPWGVAVAPFGVVPEPTGGARAPGAREPTGAAPGPSAPEPSDAAAEPYPTGPLPTGSEYVRWVQSTLNDLLGLRLPLHGVADAATRSAIRSFQRREGLPVDGIVGPDTERALLASRAGKSGRRAAPGPAAPDLSQPSDSTQPAAAGPDTELGFEWENFEHEFGDTGKIDEGMAVRNRVVAGQRDPNRLTDIVFFQRHPERRGRRLRADEYKLVAEWKAILRNVVLPALTHARAPPAAGTKFSDRDVRDTLKMAATPAAKLGITLEQLLTRHQAEAGGIPIEVLLAFIHYEAENLFSTHTAGYWQKDEKTKKPLRYIPSPQFYELGIFQTPAGLHGCVPSVDIGVKRECKYDPPGLNVKKDGVDQSEFHKGWWKFKGSYPNESNWTDPEMQVRIGLWNLTCQAENIRQKFEDLFPSKQSEWYLRMAVLYTFAAGPGAAGALLRTYKKNLLRLPEEERWDFLRSKNIGSRYFKNVDEKMSLATKLRAARGATLTQSRGEPR